MNGAASSTISDSGMPAPDPAVRGGRRARMRAITESRARRTTWIRLGAALAITYGVAILLVAALSPSLSARYGAGARER